MTDEFVKVFHEVDGDNDHVINVEDLERYCDENNLKRAFVDKWLKLFDLNKDGKIEYYEFLQVLGITQEPVTTHDIELTSSDPFKIFRIDMSNDLAREVVDITRKASDQIVKEKPLAQRIIQDIEKSHPKFWNIKINTDHDQRVEYDPEGVIFFTIDGRKTFLIWRTHRKIKKGACGCC